MTPTQPMTAIQIEGKMYLREENPFDPYSPKHAKDSDFSEFDQFSRDHPPVLCLFPCEPGQTFEVGKDVELVWQTKAKKSIQWLSISTIKLSDIKELYPFHDWRQVCQLIPQDTADQEINKMAHTLYPEPEPVEPSDPMNDWDWAKESKEQPQAETVEQASLEWLNECRLANRIPTVQGCFIAGSSYERQKTEAIIKKVLERAAENAEWERIDYVTIVIDKQSILNTDYSDLI